MPSSASSATVDPSNASPKGCVFLPRQRLLLIVCCTAVVTAGILYPLVRWQTLRVHCKDDGEEAPPAQSAGRFAEDPSLKFVVVMFRHGDRTPVYEYKTDPHANAFPEEKGYLTKRGKQHMYKKGQILRHLYNGFLSDLYLDREIVTKTTNMIRTHMSAALVLAGLYPPKDYQKWSDLETVWQPIPIYHDSPDQTPLFSNKGICPAFDSVVKECITQIYNNTDNITEPLFSYLTEKCGQPVTRNNLFKLYDTLKTQASANLQLPEWLEPNYWQVIKSIHENKKSAEIVFGNSRLQQFTIGRMIQEIGFEMESRLNESNQHTSRKIHFYSGHDISLGMTLGFLDTFVGKVDFGASLHFHLHFDEKKENTIIKIFYFDRWDEEEGREVTIPNCGNHCKLQDFIQRVRYNFPRDPQEGCHKAER